MIRLSVVGRQIQQHNSVLGMQGENGVELVEFAFPHSHPVVDMAPSTTAYILLQTKTGKPLVVLIREEDIFEEGSERVYRWLVGKEATEEPGQLTVQIVFSSLSAQMWKSELSIFRVGRSLDIETPQPLVYSENKRQRVAMTAGIAPRIANPETEPPITVAERKIIIPAQLRNISVQNDENAETVSIVLPRFFDGADLSTKSIILKTVSKGGRDDVPFLKPVISDKTITMAWTLKPPQTSFEGELKIQLQVYGLVSAADSRPYVWQTEYAAVNIITSLDGAPVIPATPSIMDDFLKQIAQIAASEGSAAQSEQARKDTEAIKNETQKIKDDTNQLKNLAQLSETNAKISADKAAVSESTAKTYRDESEGYAQIAQESAENVAASETAARDEADRAKREADRSEREADRSEDAANRAHNFNNLERGISQIGQGICDSTYALNSAIMNGFHGTDMQICGVNHNIDNCCCTTNRNIDAVRYENAKNTCDIIQASHNDTDRVIAFLTNDKIQALQSDLQSAQLQLSNSAQTTAILNALRPTPVPAYPSCSPYEAYNPPSDGA